VNTNSRTVRVFLSSTFRDFAEERDLLVRKIFPELRRKCRERQVELVDVDLRWGITEKEAQQGKVLPICLAEIDRSRPFFMGFIGERYGWVPEQHQYDLSLVMEQPWLEEHRGGKSVTELEMLHGVLNNSAMEDRAFFYFRDPKWSKKKGGAYLSEGTAEKVKLEALKERIRKSNFPVVENYRTPAHLAERVREDLWKLIDEAFPENEVPDPLAIERNRHLAYGATRRRLYIGGEKYFKALDEAMKAKPYRPVLITGQSGGGKSALVANWVAGWKKAHPKTVLIVHHLGCGADAADSVRMAIRIMQEIAWVTGEEFKPEGDPDKQLEQLQIWLSIVSVWAKRNKKELLIVLDGLDKVSDRTHLRWFPSFLPPKVKLVASCLNGDVLEAARPRLKWRELKLRPFTKAEQSRFIKEYLGRYRKALTVPQRKLLQAHPLSGNPLFLLTVLEELRVFGVHEQLEQRLRKVLSKPASKKRGEAPSVDDVFEHVLDRIEADSGRKPVQLAMEAIWASRAGLFNDELLSIAKLAPAKWAAIHNSLDESLYEGSGKINFGHDYLRKAVEDRYGVTGKKKLQLHQRLSKWFERQSDFFHGKYHSPNHRKAFELPYQLVHAKDVKNIIRVFTAAKFLMSSCSCGYTLDLLNQFSQASLLTNNYTLLEWRDFLKTNAFMLFDTPELPVPIAFLQLALESGTSHPMRTACLGLIQTELPKGSIYVSLAALRRKTYRKPINIINTFTADGSGVLLADVVPINHEYFASFGETHELWHVSEGLKFSRYSVGPSNFCYSDNSLQQLIKQSGIVDLQSLSFDSQKSQLNLVGGGKCSCHVQLAPDVFVHWTHPEFGARYFEVKNAAGRVVTSVDAHTDAICGAVQIGRNRFLTWGWDSRIIAWEYDELALRELTPRAQKLHTERPNRWLFDKKASRTAIWTYRPSLDDLGYEEDGTLSVWNYKNGSLDHAFHTTPYFSVVELYEDAVKIDDVVFRYDNHSAAKSPSSENLIARHVEKSCAGDQSFMSSAVQHNEKVFTGYAFPSPVMELAEIDNTKALVSGTGEIMFVVRADQQ